ncbi:permease [Salinirubrum litoreum]|uniref:Permease n=1 Tax=Salinirubrum litoreum TaxID=1126234 RepID=A0ABD5R7V6_9EURY|nr:permease [Salinirubrum litoreum]
MALVETILAGIGLALDMAWETWWALVLGFTITGAVEEFTTEEGMTKYLGDDGWREVGLGTAFGAATSSCSFSAVATAKTLYKKGASPVSSLAAFQFAATDLVVELGLVMWILLGWQFVAADFFGGLIAVGVLVVVFRRVPQAWWDEAYEHVLALEESTCALCGMTAEPADDDTVETTHDGESVYFCCAGCQSAWANKNDADLDADDGPEMLSTEGWKRVSANAVREWDMLWEDIALGFLIAGLIGAFVPRAWWATLFGTGDGFLFVLTSAVIAVVIGVVTFICSVGNVPFALILWSNGIAFGSVLTFIFADLIIPPIVNAYRRYYGSRMAAVLFLSMAAAAIVAGVTVHYVFDFLQLIPAQGQAGGTAPEGYTLVGNLLATPVFLLQVTTAYGTDTVGDAVLTVIGVLGTVYWKLERTYGVLASASKTLATALATVIEALVTVAGAVGSAVATAQEAVNDEEETDDFAPRSVDTTTSSEGGED